MISKQHWYLTNRGDTRARLLADRHYSRQTPGTKMFTAPGQTVVLIIPKSDGTAAALWVSQRPAPGANLDKPRADGMDYWNNAYFRNESGIQSSLLIREAVAITRYFWCELPIHGMHSFVDPRHVRGVKVHGKTIHGFCFMKAGFRLSPLVTKERKLLRWIFSKQALMRVDPQPPLYEQLRLFA